MGYQPGKHLIATLHTKDQDKLNKHAECKSLFDRLIDSYNLKKLGEVYHDFTPVGFTAVVCLSESHLSIHTWPENGIINTDIYLSNYLRENDQTVLDMFQSIVDHFNAEVLSKQILTR